MKPKKQHAQPCSRCPFRRGSLPGWLGGATAENFQRMAQSEARMPCHTAGKDRAGIDYSEAQEPGTREHALPQCAGRAIHWANQLKTPRVAGQLLELPKNTIGVFEWPIEFLNHHKEYPR